MPTPLPQARHNNLVVQQLDDELLVYDLTTNKAHCLNGSSALIWKLCDGDNSVADLVAQFEANGGGRVNEDFVWLALEQLSEKDLLQGEFASKFTGWSRRQVIKTIGLASMAALPVIASLVAPQRALGSVSCDCFDPGQMTQCLTMTGCPGTTCNINGQCI